MSEAPKVYRIEYLTDIFKIPKDRRAAFLAELPGYLEETHRMIELLEGVKLPGMVISKFPSAMNWTDDGIQELTGVSFTHEGETVIDINFKNAHEGKN